MNNPSPIDSDGDVSAYAIDFDKLGIPNRSPFDILARPRTEIKPPKAKKKRGTKTNNNIAKTMATLRDNTVDHFNTPITTREEEDRTASILMGVV